MVHYNPYILTQPMDPEKKSLNFIFPTKYITPKSLKFSHWPSKYKWVNATRILFIAHLAMGFLRGSLRMIPSSSALLPRLPLKTDGNRLFLLDDLTVGLSL